MRTGAVLAAPHSRYPPLPSPTGVQAPHATWHSPVPYLFGGLAAMLGLIALALLILACSYWKLSTFLDDGDGDSSSGDRGGDGKTVENGTKPAASFVDHFVVIMAGDQKPSFLATPIAKHTTYLIDDAGEQSKDSERSKDVGKEHVLWVSVPGGDGNQIQSENNHDNNSFTHDHQNQ